jgi:branched-subunit amino acid transport protein
MSPLVLLALALITYASRAAALVLLPRPTGRFEAVLARMPAPIFASLAALSLVRHDRSLADAPVLCAALGALLISPRRSLPLSLIGGVAGYAAGRLLF